MLSRAEYLTARTEAATLLRSAGIVLTKTEEEGMDVADFGLGRLRVEGAEIVRWFDTEQISARAIVQFPGQTEPEHWHIATPGRRAKEETLRVLSGAVYLYVPGESSLRLGRVPEGKEDCYTARREVLLRPGDQFTIEPNTRHWFQAGEEGAVMLTLSTRASDELDRFTDPEVVRKTLIAG